MLIKKKLNYRNLKYFFKDRIYKIKIDNYYKFIFNIIIIINLIVIIKEILVIPSLALTFSWKISIVFAIYL